MSKIQGLQREVQAGDIFKPWLRLGPFYQDLGDHVQGLTLFEKAGASVGRAAMDEIINEAHSILTTTPHEGETAKFRGQTARWALVRCPEQYLSWGTYNISNHLGAAFLATVITPSIPGTRRWRLLTDISLRALVVINGKVVYTAEPHSAPREQGFYTYEFEAVLEPGDNDVTLALFRLGRMARVGCRLELVDSDAHTKIQLCPGMDQAQREALEDEVNSLRLERDIFYPHHAVGIAFNLAPHNARLQLIDAEGNICYEATPEAKGFTKLCAGDDLQDGSYTLMCTWFHQDISLTSRSFDLKKVTPVQAPQGYERLNERRAMILSHYATNIERRPIWPQVARYALQRNGHQSPPVDEHDIRETCEFIAARKDCADFVIQGILRLMMWERETQRLSTEINALMKETVLGFKYWVDEPGDTVMYMGSENHRLLFHVAEWMAGQLFPTELFTNSQMRGLYHATKGRTYITEWLRQRGRFGFDEWHSNSYYPITITPLLNVYDFAIHEDYKLRQMAGAVLDVMFFNLAADTLNGVFGTTHGRSYGRYLKYPDFENTSSTCWLLYGTSSLVKGSSGMAPVSLATSVYPVPKLLFDIANDTEAVVESRQRQGLLRGTVQSAHFCVYRTPDYMLSGLQDHRKGEHESSSHVAQITLGKKQGEQAALIFWSCPHTTGEGSGLRPDYWSGHLALPRVIQYRNVLSLTWRVPSYGWMTHAFFEQTRFDEVQFCAAKGGQGKWAFARVGNGYVGIYSQNGFEIGTTGPYAGRELVCYANTDDDKRENTWIVECGREADWGSFDAFVKALSSADISVEAGHLRYASPSIGTFVTGWDIPPTVNGEPVPLRGYPLVESPWAYSEFGSGEMTLHYGDEVYELWFNQ